VGVLLGTSGVAFAQRDVQACLNASEKGQRARTAGKLREARENFIICGDERCPTIVRHDCAQWNSELASSLPTVVFGARDKQGRDLFDVTVAIDGEPIVKKLDGKSVTVDPGKHIFKFEAAGFPPVTETVLVKEGERARVITVTFDSGTPVTKPPPGQPDKPAATGGGSGGHTPYPWILVGVGGAALVAGLVIVLTTPDRPTNCNEDTQKCTRNEGQSEDDFRKDQERAGTADSQPVLGVAVAAGGLALAIGGLVWHFVEPTEDSRRSSKLRVTPWTTGRSTGLSLTKSF